jgi:hypothetical protein
MPRGVSLLDEARIQGRLWTPAEFRPTIWVSALNLNTVASATGVSSLANMGTAGGSFVQATAANQALFRRGDGDRGPAYPYLDFDGTNDSLSLSAAAGAAINRFMYLFAVCRPGPNTAAFKSTIYGSNDGSLWVGRNSSQWRHAGSGSVTDTAYANGRQVGTLTFTAFSTGVAYNMPDSWGVHSRSLVGVSGAGIDFARNPTHLARGDSGSGATTAATKLAEFLAIPFDIGLAGLRKVEGYLAWGHGLPLVAEHPFASKPPLRGD